MNTIQFKAKKIKKLLPILLSLRNIDPIFCRSIINTLKSIGQNQVDNIAQKEYKSKIVTDSHILLLLYFNIFSTKIFSNLVSNKLTKLNQEVSIYNANRHRFLPVKVKVLRNELEFQLQKELYYNYINQKSLIPKIINYFEKLNNVKYL